MTNKHKGDFEFEAGGRAYVLRFSANAVVALEEKFSATLGQLGERLQNAEQLRLADVLTMFCVGLENRHKDMTQEQRVALFDELLPIEATQIVMQAFNRAFGVAIKAGEGGDENPPKPGEPSPGTGPASTATGAG